MKKTLQRKTVKSNIRTRNRIIYFSGKRLSASELTKEQEHFKGKNSRNKNDKPFYVFELTKFTSKYIGETEKNLNRIFEKIKNMNGVLIFDESDALFGRRNQIKDSHDRYANIKTNYLLKRLEKYKGVIVSITNFKRHITKQDISTIDYLICLPIKK